MHANHTCLAYPTIYLAARCSCSRRGGEWGYVCFGRRTRSCLCGLRQPRPERVEGKESSPESGRKLSSASTSKRIRGPTLSRPSRTPPIRSISCRRWARAHLSACHGVVHAKRQRQGRCSWLGRVLMMGITSRLASEVFTYHGLDLLDVYRGRRWINRAGVKAIYATITRRSKRRDRVVVSTRQHGWTDHWGTLSFKPDMISGA